MCLSLSADDRTKLSDPTTTSVSCTIKLIFSNVVLPDLSKYLGDDMLSVLIGVMAKLQN